MMIIPLMLNFATLSEDACHIFCPHRHPSRPHFAVTTVLTDLH